jgi:hypothetical protein
MKHLRMLGLAAVAAMALMAVVGVGTASATAVYGNEAKLGVGSTIEASLTGGTARLENTSKEVIDTCTGGGMKGSVNNAGGAAATPTVSLAKADFTWTGCTQNPTITIEGGVFEFHHISGTTSSTVTASAIKVTIAGIFGVSCTFTFGTTIDLGEAEGSSLKQALLRLRAWLNGLGSNSFLCPPHVFLNADYKVTNYSNLYFEAS